MKRLRIRALFILFLLLLSSFINADEGMWLFDKPPLKIVKQKYGFMITPEWLNHFQLSSTNLDGSSGFVSSHGLVISVHHGTPVLIELSTKDRDILKSGFYAKTKEEELKCPNMELLVLTEIEDVTPLVLSTVQPGMTYSDALKARKEKMAQLEKESSEKSGLRCMGVSLYADNVYHLYKYKVYSDVRLVFAPEEGIAFFGGDNDNFDYPRHCLDICLFRIWENGKPLETPHYMHWSLNGPKEGELVFISGTPGGTSRFLTVSQIEFLRDVSFPFDIAFRQKKREVIHAYGKIGPQEARLASIRVWGLENGLKAAHGYLSGLQDAAIMQNKAKEEKEIREWVKQNPERERELGKAWDEIAGAQKSYASFFNKYAYFADVRGFDTVYFRLARSIIRQASGEEKADPRALEFPKPNDDALEIMTLANSLAQLKNEFGDQIEVKWLLGSRSAEEAAKELISGTQLKDPEVVRKLVASGLDAIYQSNDSMIKLALLIDPVAKGLKALYEKDVRSLEGKNSELILRAWLKYKGEAIRPPDANGFLRLSFGAVKGFVDNGRRIPYCTTYKSLYEKAQKYENKPPYELPARFLQKKSSIDLNVGLNFVTTADAIGGNSGSPCVNKKGEFIGVLFDINPPGLANRFIYDDTRARSILVHSKGILEALLKICDAKPLADELMGKE
jgi:hypothetical protein